MPQDIDILDPVPAPLTQDMSARTKAAIVVRFLMQEGAEIDLAALPTSLQAVLTREIADLRLIDRATLAKVIEEFAHELDSIGLTAQGGLGSALRLLEGKITNDTARRLRQDAGERLFDDPWGRIKQLDEKELLKLLDAETTEIAAVVLSKLDVTKVAALLARIKSKSRRQGGLNQGRKAGFDVCAIPLRNVQGGTKDDQRILAPRRPLIPSTKELKPRGPERC